MKRKFTAFLIAALFAMASVSSVSADDLDIRPFPYRDKVVVANVITEPQNGILVQTDGTVLTEDMVSDLDGYQEMMTWDDFVHSFSWYPNTAGEYAISDPDNAYWVALDTTDRDEMKVLGRTLRQELGCATEVYLVDILSYYRSSTSFNIKIYPREGAELFDENTIPELVEDFHFGDSETGETIYTDDNGTYYLYLFDGEVEGNALFDGYTDISEAGVMYSVYELWADFVQGIIDEHSDIIEDGEILYTNDIWNPVQVDYEAPPIWQTAGDHNADGEVNSNDAADLLVQAAQDGVAEASETAVSPDSDVNLDGVADSTDAAYILQYAALKGSGADADWVEILK